MATQLTALNLAAVKEAYALIKPKIWEIPVYKSATLSHTISSAIFCKDNIGVTGVPKVNVFFKCNHGIALAQAAAYASEERDFPIPLTVIMSKSADQGKISVIENLGATVRYCIGLLFNVPTSGHYHVVPGQGTAMLEFQQQIACLGEKPLNAVIVPIAGGALLAGLPKGSPHRYLMSRQVDDCRWSSLCLVAKSNWDIFRSKTLVHDVFPVADGEIRTAMRLALEDTKQFVEPSAVVLLAALLFNIRMTRSQCWAADLLILPNPPKINYFLT
ncbi:pyridoxal-5'-phosphate-dependent enzyme [Trichophyton rubrum]|uniref:Pyridoxal-5'-phosphate-dependent enzyme n=1 Tax=Trichophyton rubrum TaxID=5551 RepID=A0A178ER32_TRIRU|nr:pyridoxal-5'-phosphate-dependent enzyme [Trichophyton rubrum]